MSVKLNSSGGGSVTLSEPTTASDFSVSFRAASGNVIVTPVPAGNTTVAPLVFSSGTNLSTAAAGAVEYDGKVIYATPQGTQRGVIPGIQFFRLDSNLVGLNATGVQNIFGVGATLSSSTVYYFEMEFTLTKSAGATSHTIAVGYGGTATYNNVYINTSRYGATGTTFPWTPAAQITGSIQSTNSVSSTVLTGAVGSATYVDRMTMRGTISVNSGGTFIPQYTLSAAPGGAYSTVAGSFVLIYPISSSGSNTLVGTWA